MMDSADRGVWSHGVAGQWGLRLFWGTETRGRKKRGKKENKVTHGQNGLNDPAEWIKGIGRQTEQTTRMDG